jgi:hypothetical protein
MKKILGLLSLLAFILSFLPSTLSANVPSNVSGVWTAGGKSRLIIPLLGQSVSDQNAVVSFTDQNTSFVIYEGSNKIYSGHYFLLLKGNLLTYKLDPSARTAIQNMIIDRVIKFASSKKISLKNISIKNSITILLPTIIDRKDHNPENLTILTEGIIKGTINNIPRTLPFSYSDEMKFLQKAEAGGEIGPSGGILQNASGTVSLEIPQDAIQQNTIITLKQTGIANDFAPIYTLEPAGIQFTKPVTISISYDPSTLPIGVNEDDLSLVFLDEYLENLSNLVVDKENHRISGELMHFSTVSIAVDAPTGVKMSDLPLTRDFRLPIGDNRNGLSPACGGYTPSANDLGNDINLLSIESFQNYSGTARSNYPKIRFTDNVSTNRWYVAVAFNRNRYIPNYDSGATGIYGLGQGEYHPGEDWNFIPSDDSGKPIHAVADGIILFNQTQWFEGVSKYGFGNIVVIGHRISDSEMVLSVYAHMQQPSPCSVGSVVRKGDIIGLIDSTGNSYGSHLHFEIAKGSRITIDKSTQEIKIQTVSFQDKDTKRVVGQSGWYWPGANSKDVLDKYYEPSNFLKNMSGKSQWVFTINENTEGWQFRNIDSYSVNGEVDGGVLYINPAALDPYIESSPLNLQAGNLNTVEIRMASNAPDNVGAIYYKTLQDDKYTEDKKVQFIVNNDGVYHVYPIYLAANPSKWNGTITGLRIDTSNTGISNSNSDTVGVDSIEFKQVSNLPLYTIFGRILFSTTPLPNIKVELIGGDLGSLPMSSKYTNALGEFSFPGLTPGTYLIKRYGPNDAFIGSTARTVTITGSDSSADYELPKKITLISPGNGSTVSINKPTFCWEGPPEGVRYTFQMNRTNDWTLVAFVHDITTNCYQITETLSNNTQYTWLIDSYDQFGNWVGTTANAFTFLYNESGVGSQWLSFLEGNPGIPGDGVFVNAAGGLVSSGFELATPIPLNQFTDGFTLSVFPPPDFNVTVGVSVMTKPIDPYNNLCGSSPNRVGKNEPKNIK